jgi:hypothetical protein
LVAERAVFHFPIFDGDRAIVVYQIEALIFHEMGASSTFPSISSGACGADGRSDEIIRLDRS